MRYRLLSGVLVVITATQAFAQRSRSAERWLDDCRSGRYSGDRDREQYCDVREQTIPARAQLRVDGRENGGIEIIGSDRKDILVISKIQTQAGSESDAKDIAGEIRIDVGDEIRAEGPSKRWRSSWSVSYEIQVPRKIDLDLSATNGGISVRLSGDRWDGEQLDVRTTNGGVSLTMPSSYSARLEAATTHGGFDVDSSIATLEKRQKTLSTDLGGGGALVRVTTVNGGVSIRRGN